MTNNEPTYTDTELEAVAELGASLAVRYSQEVPDARQDAIVYALEYREARTGPITWESMSTRVTGRLLRQWRVDQPAEWSRNRERRTTELGHGVHRHSPPPGVLYPSGWMFADLRCPACGSRGHWRTCGTRDPSLYVEPEEVLAEAEAGTYTYLDAAVEYVPLRKPRDDEAWFCGRCPHWTWDPIPREMTEGARTFGWSASGVEYRPNDVIPGHVFVADPWGGE